MADNVRYESRINQVNRKIKVLVLSNGTRVTYKFRKELLVSLLGKKYEVVLSAPDDGFCPELQCLGIRFVENPLERRGMNILKDVQVFFQYIQLIRTEKPDIILGYTIKPNIYGNLAAKFFGLPVISTITGLGDAFLSSGFFASFIRFLYRVSLSKRTRIAFQNESDKEIFLRARLTTESKCFLLPGSGVNLDEFTPLPYPHQTKLVFTYIGRILRTKGINELLDASQKVKKIYSDEVEIKIVGPLEDDYAEQIADYSTRGMITYLDFQADIRPVIKNSNCIVLPSYQEGMSNALLEAAAMARPLIATNINGCKEIINNGVNGFLCEPRSSESLFQALESFLKLSFSEKERMATESRKIVEQKFNRAVVVETMINEIFSLVPNC